VIERVEPETVARMALLRYMSYPVTPTLSVEAVQETETLVEPSAVALTPAGVAGGVVSAVGVVTVTGVAVAE